MSVRIKGRRGILLCIIFLAATFASFLQPLNADAAQITNRKLQLESGATDGGSKAGGVVNHFFTFTVPTTATIGSIKFQYCTAASGTCNTPTGLVTTAATLAYENNATGFSINNSVNGSPYITRSASQIASTTVVSYRLGMVTNPTTANQAFFVRISTYNSVDTSGSPIDEGTVAASTANQIVLSGTMPESLIFCTGATISTNVGGVPDCSTATAGTISFNQLFSPTDTATATSQMAASTNATGGFTIGVVGPTLTSGIYTIDAMGSTATLGARGKGQFGMNLRANTATTSSPIVGTDVAPTPGVGFKGQAAAGFDEPDKFRFEASPAINTVANSGNGGFGPTNAQIFTTSYMVNVPGSQTAGTYTTTLTYVCTATF